MVLAGCIPEDSFLALRYSPDGQLLAVVSEKNGLVVADPAGMEVVQVADGHVDPSNVAWTTNSLALAYSSSREGSYDIYLSTLDGVTTRVTASPARDVHPMIHGPVLLYLTTESGVSEITTHTLVSDAASTPVVVPEVDWSVVSPELSPDGRRIAAYGFVDMRPQIFSMDLETGETDQLTSETDPFSLVPGTLAWMPDSGGVGFLRGQVLPDPDEIESKGYRDSLQPQGRFFNVIRLDDTGAEQTLVRSKDAIAGARFDGDNVVYVSGQNLVVGGEDEETHLLSLDLPADMPRTGGDEGEIAFVVADQLIGVTTASLERSRVLTFDLEDKFLLAEEYFKSGSPSKSYSLYEELAASVKRTRDPDLARFVYIANLRRLGRTENAVREVEAILAEGNHPESVPPKYLWRLLGFSYLLELDDLEKAAESFEHYREITSASMEGEVPDSALNALDIIRNQPPEVARLYARAVKARLNGNFMLTDQLFSELLKAAPQERAVQREYLNALDGFDREVYYFSPTQRPFTPTRSQRADYLQRFVDSVTSGSVPVRDAQLELFLLRIEMGSYSRARKLLDEALTSVPLEGRPDGILQVFKNYIETPEPLPWINQAMPEVFLHESIRPRLEMMITTPADRLLLSVVATKVAILQNEPDRARAEANAGAAEWGKIPQEEQAGELAALYGRLMILRAREAELRGLYAEAAEGYDQAVAMLLEKKADNFEMQEEIRYRASLMRMLLGDYPEVFDLMRTTELRAGIELINPNWDPETLQICVRDYLELYDTTSATLKQWIAYECGVLFSKLHRSDQARAALMQAVGASAPDFLRRKAMMELAAIDEYTGDPWNAARWYSRIAAIPDIHPDVRLWCSYQIARLHLSINYNVSAAREALAVIVSNRPEGPLAIQAQELLISTSTR